MTVRVASFRSVLVIERMSQTRDGPIAYRLRHAQKGEATRRVMRPIDFLARVAAIIPPPRHPLLRTFGVFGPPVARARTPDCDRSCFSKTVPKWS
jgi:hypothetical protein